MQPKLTFICTRFLKCFWVSTRPKFITFIEDICTLSFTANIEGNTSANSTIKALQILVFTALPLLVLAPSIVYLINGTTPPPVTINWILILKNQYYFQHHIGNSSLKSNRGYTGIVYLENIVENQRFRLIQITLFILIMNFLHFKTN
jgi:hypothetical protein